MKKDTLHAIWDMQRLRNGIGLRCIEAIPADKLDAHPIPNMRTPKELIVHMYEFQRAAADGIKSGAVPSPDEKAVLATLRTREDVLRYVNDAWSHAHGIVSNVTDAQANGKVSTAWGGPYTTVEIVGMVQDEYLHHRGQLYAYLRTLGSQGPMNWDFENSASEFQPKQETSA